MKSIAYKILKNLYPPEGPTSRPIATPELAIRLIINVFHRDLGFYPSSRKDLSVVTRYWKHLAFDICVDIIDHARLLHATVEKKPDLTFNQRGHGYCEDELIVRRWTSRHS